MRWTWLGVCLLFVLPACRQSTLGKLTLTSVSPQHVSARGGTRVVLSGSGFGTETRVRVRGVPARVVSVRSNSLTVETPTLVAGPAPIDADNGHGLFKANLDPALQVEPIAITFAQAPTWQLPTLPGAVTSLVVWTAAGSAAPRAIAGTSAGAFALKWEAPGRLDATPLRFVAPPSGDLDAGAGPSGGLDGGPALPPEPGVTALAVDADAGLLAACVDDATLPMRLLDLTTTPPTYLADGVQQPVSCQGLAFVRVDPGAPRWLVARTATGLMAWQPVGAGFAPRMQPPPTLAGAVTAISEANLGGGEVLLVGGKTDTAFWSASLALSSSADAGPDQLGMPFPVPSSENAAFATLDANHDGVVDVYVAGPGQDELLIGDGHGQFFDEAWELLPFERSTGRAVATGDFDLDGRTDIVVATEDGPDRLFVASDTAFVDQTPLLGLDGPFGSEAVVVLDIDGDGTQDILTGGSFPGGLRLRVLVPSSPNVP
jgi:hypothetical protein